MNPILPKLVSAFAALLVLAARGAASTTPAPVSASLQQRIDALLQHRLKPEPLPTNPPNPFQLIGSARRGAPEEPAKGAAAGVDASPTAPVGATDEDQNELNPNGSLSSEALITCATRLKLGGVIILKDQIQIVVNGVPRREGDSVAAEWNNAIIYLKITRLLPGQMVLRYGEAEATVKF